MNRPLSNAQLDQIAVLQQRRHKFVLYGELDASANKDWLVRGLLGAGEQSAFYGKPGSGKSVLVGDLGLHVAAGLDWHGRKVQQGGVLYLALERRKLVERRVIAWRNFHEIRSLPFAIIGGVMDFKDIRTAALVVEIVHEAEAATRSEINLIIIDTLSRALAGGDENAPRDMGALVRTIGQIHADTGAHILTVHHTPQEASERLRGHGALLGAMDSTVNVEKLTDGLRSATVAKANDSEEGTALNFDLTSVTIGTDDEGQETTAPVVVSTDAPAVRPKAASQRIPKAAQTALRALAEAIDELGTSQSADGRVPSDRKAVSVDEWRARAYRLGISTGEERAQQQAFKRASEHLIGIQRVGFWDGLVWLP